MEKKDISKIPDAELPPVREDFRKSFQWRIFRIMAEFVEGFHFVADFGKKSVAIFGSSKFTEENPNYQKARLFGELLAKNGFTVVTGGGPGIMEGANRGAYENEGDSVGINIQIGDRERANQYMNRSTAFHYFFTRKVMLSFASSGYVFFPGGFGTLDEFFEIVTLIQTKKLPLPVCVVAVDKEFWEPFFNWMEKDLCEKHGTITKKDLQIFNLVDTPEEAMEVIKKEFDYKNNGIKK